MIDLKNRTIEISYERELWRGFGTFNIYNRVRDMLDLSFKYSDRVKIESIKMIDPPFETPAPKRLAVLKNKARLAVVYQR